MFTPRKDSYWKVSHELNEYKYMFTHSIIYSLLLQALHFFKQKNKNWPSHASTWQKHMTDHSRQLKKYFYSSMSWIVFLKKEINLISLEKQSEPGYIDKSSIILKSDLMILTYPFYTEKKKRQTLFCEIGLSGRSASLVE